MQYKNIIFDLGNVLVKAQSGRMHQGFQGDRNGELANPNPESEG